MSIEITHVKYLLQYLAPTKYLILPLKSVSSPVFSISVNHTSIQLDAKTLESSLILPFLTPLHHEGILFPLFLPHNPLTVSSHIPYIAIQAQTITSSHPDYYNLSSCFHSCSPLCRLSQRASLKTYHVTFLLATFSWLSPSFRIRSKVLSRIHQVLQELALAASPISSSAPLPSDHLPSMLLPQDLSAGRPWHVST